MNATSQNERKCQMPTIRWTSGEMHLEDQGNGDSCWVLASEYTALQDQMIALQAQHIALQARLIAFQEQAAKCRFTDALGHPLHMNAAYQALHS